MRRLLKYLKPYTLLIILSMALLFVQANADLALPDYLSRIVNNGIQQNGVENAVPVVIRQSELEKLLLFMDEEETDLVLTAYLPISPTSPDAELYLTDYPGLADEAIYVLKDVDKSQMELLNRALGEALVAVSRIQGMIEDPSMALPLGEGFEIDPSRIPEGMDVFQALAMMPESQRAEISARMSEIFDSLGKNLVTQMAVGAVKSEYEALGMDAGAIQRDYILRIGGTMLLISLIGGVSTIAVAYLASKTAAGAARDIRKDVFKKVESFSSAEFNKFSTASLITRSTNDITQVQTVIFMFMRMVFFAPIIGIGGIIRAIEKSANMWWIIAVAVLTLVGLIIIVFIIAVPKFKIMQDLIDRLNLVTRENLSGMMVIRDFNKEEGE